MNNYGRVLGRALALGIGNACFFALPYLLLTSLGMDAVPAAAIGVIFVLAPGAYDYLDRDLGGRRIEVADPVEGNAPFIRFPSGKLTRPEDNGLNQADFVWISRKLLPAYAPLASLVAEIDRDAWMRLDPESEIAKAVLATVSEEIERTPDWVPERQLPLVALFLVDLETMLRGTLGLDFDTPVEPRAPRRPERPN